MAGPEALSPVHLIHNVQTNKPPQQIMKRDLNAGLGGGPHCDELAGRFLDGLFRFFPHEATRAGRWLASGVGCCPTMTTHPT